MKPLTETERHEWEDAKKRIKQLHANFRDGFTALLELGRLIDDACQRKLYREQGKTFAEVARQEFGFNRCYCDRLRRAAKYFDSQKLLVDCGQSELVLPKTIEEAAIGGKNVYSLPTRKAKTEIIKPDLLPMPTRRDDQCPVFYTKPLLPPAQQISAKDDIQRVLDDLDKLIQYGGLPIETLRWATDAFTAAKRIQALLVQTDLPGMDLPPPHRKNKGTLEECQRYAMTIPFGNRFLTKEDGTWFFNKCEGCGWKNNGKAIVDWQATVRAWVQIGVFPSQKAVNGHTGPKSIFELKTVLEVKERLASDLKSKGCTESGLERRWSSEKKRLEYLKLRGEIKSLTEEISKRG